MAREGYLILDSDLHRHPWFHPEFRRVSRRRAGTHRNRVHCAGDRHLCSCFAGWGDDRARLGSRLPRGDPEPADPVGRARGSRTICTAKWCIYVTSSAPAVEGLGAAMSLSTDRQPGANP